MQQMPQQDVFDGFGRIEHAGESLDKRNASEDINPVSAVQSRQYVEGDLEPSYMLCSSQYGITFDYHRVAEEIMPALAVWLWWLQILRFVDLESNLAGISQRFR